MFFMRLVCFMGLVLELGLGIFVVFFYFKVLWFMFIWYFIVYFKVRGLDVVLIVVFDFR